MKAAKTINANMTARFRISAMARATLIASVVLMVANTAFAQRPSVESSKGTIQSPVSTDDQKKMFDKLERTLTGSKFVGNFTIIGQDNAKLTPEEYHIESVRKMENGNFWMFRARIKYGGKDLSVPMPLEIEWAGDTPVITLTKVAIPFMGTFSARVVIYNNKYAGTWSGGDHGGHLFGSIVPDEAEGVDIEKTEREQKEKSKGQKDK